MDLESFFSTGNSEDYMNWGAAGGEVTAEQIQQETGFDEYNGYDSNYMMLDLMALNPSEDWVNPYNGQTQPGTNALVGFYNYFIEQNPMLPTGYIIQSLSDAVSVTFDVTITMSNEEEHELTVSIPEDVTASYIQNNSLFLPQLIANAINESDIAVGVNLQSGAYGSGQSIQYLFNTSGADYVSNINIVANGTLLVEPTVSLSENGISAEAIASIWYSHAEIYFSELGFNIDELEAFKGMLINVGYFMGWNYMNYIQSSGVAEADEQAYESINLTNQQLIDIESSLIENTIDQVDSNEGGGNDSTMQILGHHSFSDYLVLLGTWLNADNSDSGLDFIVKTSQKKDGSLTTLNTITDKDIFEVYFLGNLGFQKEN